MSNVRSGFLSFGLDGFGSPEAGVQKSVYGGQFPCDSSDAEAFSYGSVNDVFNQTGHESDFQENVFSGTGVEEGYKSHILENSNVEMSFLHSGGVENSLEGGARHADTRTSQSLSEPPPVKTSVLVSPSERLLGSTKANPDKGEKLSRAKQVSQSLGYNLLVESAYAPYKTSVSNLRMSKSMVSPTVTDKIASTILEVGLSMQQKKTNESGVYIVIGAGRGKNIENRSEEPPLPDEERNCGISILGSLIGQSSKVRVEAEFGLIYCK